MPGPSGPSGPSVPEAAAALRSTQKPLKAAYRQDPESALVSSTATARVDQAALTATVPTWAGELVAGLHPATGGKGALACSADIVLQALVACAGVTLAAVATASGVELRSASVTAHAIWDARGTLGVDPDAPVGLTAVELILELVTDAEEEKVARLLELTERYCVVARTLKDPVEVTVRRG